MGFCSAVTLAFATIFSLAAVALLAIAFSTDNWLTIHVNRGEVQVELKKILQFYSCIKVYSRPFNNIIVCM